LNAAEPLEPSAEPERGRSPSMPARLIMAVFFLQAVGLANWFPRIPDLQAKLGIGPGELGVAQLGMPVATVIGALLAGTIVGRFGSRRVLIVLLPAITLGVALPGFAWNAPLLFAALFLIGLGFPIVDVAMNVEANRIERDGGRRIMNTCHGCWSVGSVAGGLSAAAFAAGGVAPGWHLLVFAAAMLPLTVLVPRALPVVPPEPASRVVFSLPSRGMLLLCFFLFGALMVEATARNWAAVFVHDVVGASAVYGGITYGAYALLMATGRFAGDRLVDRFGPVATARTSCLVALAGLALVVLAGSPVEVVVGFAAAGFGIATAFPLSVTAAAGRGDRPAPVNVAALQFIGVAAFLVAPPLIGAIAEVGGLRLGLAVTLPMILMSVALAGELRTGTRPR